MKRIKPQVGCVFSIPVGEDAAVAHMFQVIGPGFFAAIVYDRLLSEIGEITSFTPDSSQVKLILATSNQFLNSGKWTVLGKLPVPNGLRLPAYQCEHGQPGNVVVVNFEGDKRRPADRALASVLPYRTTWNVYGVQQAVESAFGVGEWYPDNDVMFPPPKGLSSSELFPE